MNRIQVARDGGVDLFDKIFEKYRNEQMAEEKRRLAGALCSFKDKHAIEKALTLIKSALFSLFNGQ